MNLRLHPQGADYIPYDPCVPAGYYTATMPDGGKRYFHIYRQRASDRRGGNRFALAVKLNEHLDELLETGDWQVIGYCLRNYFDLIPMFEQDFSDIIQKLVLRYQFDTECEIRFQQAKRCEWCGRRLDDSDYPAGISKSCRKKKVKNKC
jgi:hypothetical protein